MKSLAAILAAIFLAAPGCALDGEELFSKEGCLSCHRFRGRGGYLGPDLTAVAARRGESSIRKKIREPAASEPGTRMPAYGNLSRREVSALVRYLGD